MRQKDLLEGLPVFLAVVELLGFSGAARRLGISASAASPAVRKLEVRVGTPLLRRSTRSLSLTDPGAEYVGRAGPALRELLLATEDAVDRSGQPSGPLRLTTPRSTFDGAVAPLLARFRSRTTGLVRPWAVQRNGETVQGCPPTRTVVGDLKSQLDLIVRGLGIGLAASASLSRLLDAGVLVPVLSGWSTPMAPLHLDYPDRRRQSAALRAFIGLLRADMSHAEREPVG